MISLNIHIITYSIFPWHPVVPTPSSFRPLCQQNAVAMADLSAVLEVLRQRHEADLPPGSGHEGGTKGANLENSISPMYICIYI